MEIAEKNIKSIQSQMNWHTTSAVMVNMLRQLVYAQYFPVTKFARAIVMTIPSSPPIKQVGLAS